MSRLTSLGRPIWVGDDVIVNTDPVFTTLQLIDAETEKFAVVGCIWHPTIETGTINIRKIHFRCGAVTFNVASVLTVSLQNISATAGPPYQPDGTPDQTVSMTTLSANAWNTTGALSADRAVNLNSDSFDDANSRWVCVVWEFGTFTAADSVVFSCLRPAGSSNPGRSHMGAGCLLNTGSWTHTGADAPNIVFECDDGSFAFLLGGHVVSSIPSAVAVGSAAAVRRAGMKFKFPVEVKISRLGMYCQIPNGCDGRFVLYDTDGTTELVSVNVDNDAVSSAASYAEIAFQPVTLIANAFYRYAFVGGTSTTTSVRPIAVNAVGHMDCYALGQNAYYTSHDGSVWSDVTTQRLGFKIGLHAIHDGIGQAKLGGHRRR